MEWADVVRCGGVLVEVLTAARLRMRICCIPSSDFLFAGGPYLGQMVISPPYLPLQPNTAPVDNIRLPDPVIRGTGRWVCSRADLDVAAAGVLGRTTDSKSYIRSMQNHSLSLRMYI